MRREILGLRHPFFRSKGRRIALVAFLAGWTAVELLFGNQGWAIGTGLICIYAVFQFFVLFDPADYAPKEDE